MLDDGSIKLMPRFVDGAVRVALKDTPAVMVIGPRQCGKTTLVRNLVTGRREFVTLDDDTHLAAVRADPAGFVRNVGLMTIDEIQRAPDLLRAIKKVIDSKRRAGQFLLTGSANILALPSVSESLAGRMEVVTLLPLSRAEILRKKSSFLKTAFAGKMVKPGARILGDDLVDMVLTGGYPEMLQRANPRRRRTWALNYVNAIVQRDVRDIAEVDKLDQIPRLLRVLAQHSGQLLNLAQAGGQIGLNDKTARRYVGLLEQLFLVQRVEPWFDNGLKRLVKTPKLHFLDSGLLAALLGVTAERIAEDRSIFGAMLETFVFAEVLKHISWTGESYTICHYRDKDQDEVDLVVESDQGELVGLEVKAAATVKSTDFRGLRKLAAAAGRDFKIGVVFYDGEDVIPFGDRLFAAPVSCLWG